MTNSVRICIHGTTAILSVCSSQLQYGGGSHSPQAVRIVPLKIELLSVFPLRIITCHVSILPWMIHIVSTKSSDSVDGYDHLLYLRAFSGPRSTVKLHHCHS